MAISAKDAVQKFKVELLQELPLDEPIFFAMAERTGLFPMGTGKSIRAQGSRAHKVDYFLYHVVEPGADEYLPKLLEVMKESKVANVMSLADNIQAALCPGICLSMQCIHMHVHRLIFSTKKTGYTPILLMLSVHTYVHKYVQ